MPDTSIKGQFDLVDAAVAAVKTVVDTTDGKVDNLDADLVAAKVVIDAGATAIALAAAEAKVDNLDADLVAAKVVIDNIYATMALPKIARKAVTFTELGDGAVGQHTLFTVTGGVKAKIYAICTTDLSPAVAGATISVGTPAAVDTFRAVTLAADIDVGEIWFAAVPATVLDTDANAGGVKQVIGDGADITADILVQAIASGVIEFMCEWEPITADGNVVAA